MQKNLVVNNIGKLMMIIGFSMLLPLVTAWIYQEPCIWVFLMMMPVTILFGFLLYMFHRSEKDEQVRLLAKDGYAIVTLGWVMATLFGMMPYLLAGTFHNVTDAFFEAMSGFATVGATVLDDIESAPYAILMWRSVTHWLGGMGIIVLFVAILSSMGASAMQIFKAEAAGPLKNKLQPKISDCARTLWLIYIINTIIVFLVLMLCGMDVFDALNHAFSVVATGGFSTKNASIGAYGSPLLEWVMSFAMYFAGINYALFFYVVRTRKLRYFWESLELRVYTAVTVIAILLITIHIVPIYDNHWLEALRYSAFHVTSLLTTTGFVACDYEIWTTPAKVLLILLCFSGACAGSTTCGFKIDRHIILFQQAKREIQRFRHPRMITVLKSNHQVIRDEVVHNVTTFFYLYMGIIALGTLIVTISGIDLLDAFTGVASTLGGVGPAIGLWGPVESFSSAPAAVKWIFSFLMLLGRLEIYTVLVLLKPVFRKKNEEDQVSRVVESESH